MVLRPRNWGYNVDKKAYDEGYAAGVKQAMLDTGLIKLGQGSWLSRIPQGIRGAGEAVAGAAERAGGAIKDMPGWAKGLGAGAAGGAGIGAVTGGDLEDILMGAAGGGILGAGVGGGLAGGGLRGKLPFKAPEGISPEFAEKYGPNILRALGLLGGGGALAAGISD
jgi:hypothetical protein